MTEYASLEDLIKPRAGEDTEDYDLPGVGTIAIRSLNRAEFIQAQRRFENDMEKQEQFILSRCVVKPEGVTEAVVAKWQKASPIGEINALAMRINEMSGIKSGADKSSVD